MKAYSGYGLGLVLLLALTSSARAAQIPVGTLTYLGNAPDGSSVFRVVLTPPAGVTFDQLVPSFFTDQTGRSFVLPPPLSTSPLTYDFLFATGPGTGFRNCPCKSASFVFAAGPGTRVAPSGKNMVVERLSSSFLDPSTGDKFIVPQQSATIYLTTHGHKNLQGSGPAD